jgi:hypothetical protein
LAATASLLLLVFAIISMLWYPGAYFAISGVGKLFLILVGVSVIVGPGLSAFVYKPGKKGLATDFALLAAVELVAVVFAVSLFYARQPYYTVFAADRFESVSRPEVDTSQLAFAALHKRPGHEPRLVYAELPKDRVLFERLMDETVFEGKKDIDRRPEFWRPYTAGIPVLKAAARPIETLLNDDSDRAAKVQRWLSQQEGSYQDYLFLPLRGKSGDVTMILHADIGYPVDILAVDPW